MNQLLTDPHILQLQTGQGREERIGVSIQPGSDDVDQLDVPLLLGSGLEELVLACADRLLP